MTGFIFVKVQGYLLFCIHIHERYFLFKSLAVYFHLYSKETKRKGNILPFWKILKCFSLISFLGQIFVRTLQLTPEAF